MFPVLMVVNGVVPSIQLIRATRTAAGRGRDQTYYVKQLLVLHRYLQFHWYTYETENVFCDYFTTDFLYFYTPIGQAPGY